MRIEASKGTIANTASGSDSSGRQVNCGHHYRGSSLTRDRVCGLPPTVTCGHHYRGYNPLIRWTKRYRPTPFVDNKNTFQNISIRPRRGYEALQHSLCHSAGLHNLTHYLKSKHQSRTVYLLRSTFIGVYQILMRWLSGRKSLSPGLISNAL